MNILRTPLSVRVHAVRAGAKPAPARDERQESLATVRGFRTTPVVERLLVVRMLQEEEGARKWPGGVFQIIQRQRDGAYGPTHPVRLLEPTAGLILPTRMSRADCEAIRDGGQSCGFPLVPMQEFIHRVLFVEGHRGPTTICAYDDAVVLSSLATTWNPGKGDRRESFILTLCPNPGGHRGCPRIALTPMTPPSVRIEFTRVDPDAAPVFGPYTPGRFYPIRAAVFALTNEDLDLWEACRAFGISPPERPRSSSLQDRVDTCLRELDAVCGLIEVTMRELLRHEAVVSGGNELDRAREKKVSVGAVQSPGTVAKGYLRAAGIDSPPLRVTPDLGMTPDDVHGACMGSFYPGRMEVLIRHEPVPSAVCDIRAEYPAAFSLQGVGEFLTAAYVEAYDATAEAKMFLATVTPEDMLRRETWLRLPILCLLYPDHDFLPTRIHYANRRDDTDTGEREVVWGQVTVPPTLDPTWYALGDLWVSQQETGQPIGDRIIRAIGFRLVGRKSGLRPVLYGGIVPVTDPAAGLIKAMVEARPGLEAQGFVHLGEGVKVQVNTAAFGIWAEVHRHDLSPRSRVKVWVYDGLRRRLMRTRPLVEERPGPFYFPPIATLVTAGGRVMLYLIEHFTREAGGDLAMLAVDSAAIIPTDRAPDPIAIYRAVAERLESLNPWSIKPFLRLDKAHGDLPRPHTFFGVTTSRYCLFARDGRGHDYRALDPSGQVLGQYLDPLDGELVTVNGEMFPRFWGEAWEWLVHYTRPHQENSAPDWVHRPAIFLAGWTHPKQGFFSKLPRSQVRPFCTALVVHDTLSDAVAIGLLTRSGKRVWRRYPGGQRVEVRERTGSHLDFMIPAGGPPVIIPRMWVSVLRRHLHTPNHKFANGDSRGRMERWEITATEIEYGGKEGPATVGQATAQGMAWEDVEGAVRTVYEPVDYPAEEIARARSVLRGIPRSVAALLVGLHPRKLQDFIHSRSTPRPNRLRRCLLLARLWASGERDDSLLRHIFA